MDEEMHTMEFRVGRQLVANLSFQELRSGKWNQVLRNVPSILGTDAFKLYDTYGFPLDLTELMARERGLRVDVAGFNKLMEEQKVRARASQKKQVIELSQVESTTPTNFVGYDKLESPAKVVEVLDVKDKTAVILDTSPFYAEMGGQVGDTGELAAGGQLWRINNTQKAGDAWLHFISDSGNGDQVVNRKSEIVNPAPGSEVTLTVDRPRRNAIQRHHTVTHLLHWALHEVVSKDAVQKGSYVGPDRGQIQPHQGPQGHHAVLRREVWGLGARGPD
jgi:alanyl-tRNA synthetase